MSPLSLDTRRLDTLMERAGLDVLLVTSKHNIQYMLRGYRFFFFEYMDAIGTSRYLPLIVYERGKADGAHYFGNPMEKDEAHRFSAFVDNASLSSWRSADTAAQVVEYLAKRGITASRIGVEEPFLPVDAYNVLRSGLPNADFVDATIVLERLRALKSPDELDMLRHASEKVVESMAAVISSHGEGASKLDLVRALQREEVSRGLTWQFCLISMGSSLNRAPSDQVWRSGEVLCMDSGGNYEGYVGDMARMAVAGEPDSELKELLAEIDEVQQACRLKIAPGTIGRELFPMAQSLVERSAHKAYLSFVIHGMGLITHEAPRLTPNGPVPYFAEDAAQPLEEGMVLSVETTMHHPKRGLIKLEDTIAVVPNGYEAFGDGYRGWNQAGGH